MEKDMCCSKEANDKLNNGLKHEDKTETERINLDSSIGYPKIVSREEWLKASKELLTKEKELTRARDALNAERRKMPVVEIEKAYTFEGTDGKVSLLDLFNGYRQLIVYHFMFGPEDKKGCSGCSMLVDNMGHQAHVNARDTQIVLVSRAPLSKLEPFKKRMGWSVPWYSSFESDFNYDFGVTSNGGESFAISVFLREKERIFQSYFTSGRGVEYLGSNWSYLDITPLGRQETWEDTQVECEQSHPYSWWRLHDQYKD
ncbi:DUF899 domain-containing protein [Bacillus horti]|uniref:Dithiol-disulfide oxidoreductase (DUF899 family) n=1 Tax=Caldalkalibacillus horti TaxID=77523 RepID=A0ABT9W5J2_9BACI|nr:DUF899 domain-containing protein [Bacillus horti]MDQ0168395.1 putative dithiol-disulfide oxidoreductase (DUF899 family) [Bacillus horti]